MNLEQQQALRRCGWYICSYAICLRANGLDQLILNKIDILSGFETLKIANSYLHPTAGELKEFPNNSAVLKHKPLMLNYQGGRNINTVKMKRLQKIYFYALTIEDLSEIKISMLGIGPKKINLLT